MQKQDRRALAMAVVCELEAEDRLAACSDPAPTLIARVADFWDSVAPGPYRSGPKWRTQWERSSKRSTAATSSP